MIRLDEQKAQLEKHGRVETRKHLNKREKERQLYTTKPVGQAAENPAEKLKDIAEKLKDAVEKLHTDANTALKDAVEQDVDNHKARFACIIIFSLVM